jgi:C1A family cysteine protease
MADTFDLSAIQAAIKDAGASWRAGVTSLTSLSPAEQKLHLGYTPGPDEPSLAEREQMAAANFAAFKGGMMAAAVGAPASFDWRNVGGNNYITPVKDQGQCGSCVAFGTTATVEGTLRVVRGNPNLAVDLSEADLFYCQGPASGASCGGGWYVDPALNAYMNPGIVDEACFPYTAHDQACNKCSDWQSRVTKIPGWHKITAIADMKTWLSTRGPLDSCFTVYNDFFAYKSGVYQHTSGGVAGGHCICVVGYDDGLGCWIVKNSWGTGWGDAGFFKIAYGQCGIDGTMWAVDGVIEDAWYNNVRVIGLWAIDQDRNAWVCLSNNVGWKKVAPDNDNIFFNILTNVAAAKTGARPVSVHVYQGVIVEIYVL